MTSDLAYTIREENLVDECTTAYREITWMEMDDGRTKRGCP